MRIAHPVRIAVAALVITFVARSLGTLAEQPASRNVDVNDIWADLVLDKYRPIRNFENFQSWLGDPNQRTEEELERDLKEVTRLRTLEAKNWQALQAARRANRARIPFDPAILVAQMMGAAQDHQAAVDRLLQAENTQFRQQHGFTLHNPFFVPTGDEQTVIAQWMRSEPHRRFAEQQEAENTRYRAQIQQIAADYRNKVDHSEQRIDRLERETLKRYQQVVAAERAIREALDRKRNRTPTPRPESAGASSSSGGLTLSCNQAQFEVAVGETVNIELSIEGGKAAYELSVTRLDGETILKTTLGAAGKQSIPISFSRAGVQTAYAAVRDSAFPVNNAQVTLTFRVTGEEPKPEEPKPPQPKPPQPKPTKPTPPPRPPQPAEDTFTPRRLPAGTYQAKLWLGPPLAWTYENNKHRTQPLSVSVTFDDAGAFHGTGQWKAAQQELYRFDSVGEQAEQFDVTVTLQGVANWNSGAIELNATEGRRVTRSRRAQVSLGSTEVWLYRSTMEFDSRMSGWQLGCLPLGEALSTAAQNIPKPSAGWEELGIPEFVITPSRTLSFPDFGWAGCPKMTGSGNALKIEDGPGGGAHFLAKQDIHIHEVAGSPETRTTTDGTEAIRKGWGANPSHWYLKILGQSAAAEPPLPSAPDKGELVAFGIWPKSPLRVRSGEKFTLDAMGVYLEEPFEAVKLNNRATWDTGPGLARAPNGEFRGDVPGTYPVKVTIRRPDGRTMSDTIQIVVRP